MMKLIKNLLSNPFSIGLPILSVFILWGVYAHNAVQVHYLYYNELNPKYPALIIGFVGLLIWLAISFNDLSKPRSTDLTWISATSGRMGIPLSYGCIAFFSVGVSSLASKTIGLFPQSEYNGFLIAFCMIAPILIDIILSFRGVNNGD